MGVEEGNCLKKHYVTEECVRGPAFKGPRLDEEKEGFVGAALAAWQADGKSLPPRLLHHVLWLDWSSTLGV